MVVFQQDRSKTLTFLLNEYCRELHRSFGTGHGIRINALCPSFAPTKLFNDMADEVGARHGEDRQSAYVRTTARIPMRRLATIDEVVQAMLWACDPANSFMTGQAISIDGGLTAI